MTGTTGPRGVSRPRFLGSWGEGPAEPSAVSSEVHVWRIPLVGDGPPVLAGLPTDERRRADAFVRRGDGLRWAVSRLALRGILGRYLGIAPTEVRFERGRGGKPRAAGADLHFNLTHSFDLAICAVARTDIGVDLEKIRAAPMAAGVAAGIVSADGPIRPGEAGSAELDWAFFHAWTRVEAALKATGEGLSAIDRRSPAWIRALTVAGPVMVDGGPLLLVDLPLEAGYAGALAILGPAAIEAIRCWSWPA